MILNFCKAVQSPFRLFSVEEIQGNAAIDFPTFLSRSKKCGWFDDENLFPFTLKNVFKNIVDKDIV